MSAAGSWRVSASDELPDPFPAKCLQQLWPRAASSALASCPQQHWVQMMLQYLKSGCLWWVFPPVREGPTPPSFQALSRWGSPPRSSRTPKAAPLGCQLGPQPSSPIP